MNKPFSRLITFQYPRKGPSISTVTRRHYSHLRSLNSSPTKVALTPTTLHSLQPAHHLRRDWFIGPYCTNDAALRVVRSARSHTLESSTSHTAVVLGLILAGFVAYWQLSEANPQLEPEPASIEDVAVVFNMAANQATGHVGNLSPEQEEKLRQFWHAIFGVCGLAEKSDKAEAATKEAAAAAEAETAAPKKRFGLFRSKESPAQPSEPFKGAADGEDKFGLTKQFNEVIANHSPDTIRDTFWSMMKHDHPDALALRFLRARKWDVQKALIMLVSAMDWRNSEMKVDDDIMKNGEGGAANEEKTGEGQAKKVGADFMAQLRMGKSFLHGVDKQNRPICVVRVRLHRNGDQCPESIERYTVHVIETARLALVSPVETATIIFDMTSFSLANMDYAPVKFMIKCFEANYPESLGSVLIHNAPWIFQGIWRIIKGWLDPVVAAKVHFTNGRAGLEEFIEPSRILKELGGDEDWDYKYIEPAEDENATMKDTETRNKITQERGAIVKEIEQATLEWIREGDNEAGKAANAKRNEGAVKLRENYWTLDPYVRAKSLYDRQGVLGASGKIQWYPAAEAEVKTNGEAATAETTA